MLHCCDDWAWIQSAAPPPQHSRLWLLDTSTGTFTEVVVDCCCTTCCVVLDIVVCCCVVLPLRLRVVRCPLLRGSLLFVDDEDDAKPIRLTIEVVVI